MNILIVFVLVVWFLVLVAVVVVVEVVVVFVMNKVGYGARVVVVVGVYYGCDC